MTIPDGPEMPQADGSGADDCAAATENNTADALTCIRPAYTLAGHDANANEVDDLMIRHSLNTLAEVALAVASRRVGR